MAAVTGILAHGKACRDVGIGTPKEVANVVVFLASYVTGSVYGVDGGDFRAIT